MNLAATPPQPALLSARERALALALAEAALPASTLPGGGAATVARFERLLAGLGPSVARALTAGLWALEGRALSRRGRPFSKLDLAGRQAELEAWGRSEQKLARWLLRGILTPLKLAHFDDAGVARAAGCGFGKPRLAQVERPRWEAQVIDGRRAERDLELSCEVVVVGSGAGGAAAAYELARRGRAVLIVEAGRFHGRDELDGRAARATNELYLGRGLTFALGDVGAALWAGKAVGGTTLINSGTCFRTPERTLRRWRERYGLTGMTHEALGPYFAQVEEMLGVAPAPREHLGEVASIVARGATALGLSHRPLARNAPGCDGQGVCMLGCPTGAKRSTNVSYIPAALERGAQILTSASVSRVEIEGGRARGLTGRLASGQAFRVRADAVVVAGGALLTPLLLERSGACRSSGWLGKNLSIHPASKALALFDQPVDMTRGIPQSYSVDSLKDEGIMLEGASLPLDLAALAIPWAGPRFMELIGQYQHLASFGTVVQDHARGSVHAGPGGLPLIRYDSCKFDLDRVQRGVALICEIFLRAGAKRVLPFVHGHDEIADERDLLRLRCADLKPGDIEISAYHPLGTCRMGTDPRRSCVGPDGEAHDTANLYVADGSAVPSSLGVNPQITIMALALRTAEALDAKLARSSARPPAPAPERLAFGFRETMRGTLAFAGGTERKVSFTIAARASSFLDYASTREVSVQGRLELAGLARASPAEGTMRIDPLGEKRIDYRVYFDDDAGKRWRLVGHKTVRALAPVESMTTLPIALEDEEGTVAARGVMRFALRELPAFLASFHLRPSA